MIDKQEATKLREMGLGYKEIASKLGCSVQWCKVNLKDVQKNTKESKLIEKCIALGLRPQGITTVEIRKALVSEYDVRDNDGGLTEEGLRLYKKIKTKVREKDGTIVRPAWMVPEHVDEVFKAVLQAVDNIDRRIDEEIVDVISVINPSKEDYDSTYKSLQNQIFNLTYIGRSFSKKDYEGILSSLEEIVIELRKRVKQLDVEKKTTEKFIVDEETELNIY